MTHSAVARKQQPVMVTAQVQPRNLIGCKNNGRVGHHIANTQGFALQVHGWALNSRTGI